jgi:hypothetical protein
MTPRAALIPLLVLPLLLTGCGGSSKDQTSSGLSKPAYLSKAEGICTRINREIDKLAAPTTPQALQAFVEESLQIAEVGTGEIKALDPPAGDRAAIKAKVLDPLDGQLVEGRAFLEKVKTAVAKNDQAALGQLITHPPTGSKADLAWMRSYGFKECVDAADTGS